ncbi:abortive infection family protein [Chitinophaga defluvii]|uniref:Abortive infection family protein n=1 Tax=Chitinophaga defluvii TaxID=3163343 RepID=A0ABV2T043_9BACT
MEIIAAIEPLYNDLKELGFPKLLNENEFVRITNKLNLTNEFSEASQGIKKSNDPFDFMNFFNKSEDEVLARFLNKQLTISRDHFFKTITNLLENTIPLLQYIPSIDAVIEDLESIGIQTEYIQRLRSAWQKKDADYKQKTHYFTSLLITRSQNIPVQESHYTKLRQDLLNHSVLSPHVPDYIINSPELQHFWEFIKCQGGYRPRREYLNDTLSALISESDQLSAVLAHDLLQKIKVEINLNYINESWSKSLIRLNADPDGAITSARSLLETVCKHILENLNIEYDENLELNKLYKQTATNLNLSPEQHTEQIFKQILGGCQTVVDGLAGIRNKHGDAHGSNSKKLKPSSRHAELAVNLSGSMCKFLLETFSARNNNLSLKV